MSDHHDTDTVTPSGSIARKGVKGFVCKASPTRPHVFRVRLTDNEARVLQATAEANGTTAAGLIRMIVSHLSARAE